MAKKCACNAKHAGPCQSQEINHGMATPTFREELAAEYGQVCAQIGDLVYRRDVAIPAEIEPLLERAKALNLKAAKLNLEANEAAKAKEQSDG